MLATMDRRFGILTFQGGPFAAIATEWQRAEALGFDEAFVVDTLAMPAFVDYEPWVLLGALARETARIRIGTLVTVLPLRHPAVLAAEAISVDHISGGRLELGIGAGDYAGDLAAVGTDPWPAADRLTRFAEQLAFLDMALRGGRNAHAGRFYRSDGLELAMPVQRPRPPITVAAQGKASIALAARFADRWNSLGGQPAGRTDRLTQQQAVARTAEQVAVLDAACRAIARDPATVRRSVLAFRTQVDPLSSIDAFDAFVGSYADAGIQDFIFYWPPLASLRRHEPVPRDVRSAFERIASERILAPGVRAD
jgi:alkanesulfonate monooxygenase SsuD/methylene tetrahydromethanopterin reductase-like flavin-dependent oxidoreductase (luciferase family)